MIYFNRHYLFILMLSTVLNSFTYAVYDSKGLLKCLRGMKKIFGSTKQPAIYYVQKAIKSMKMLFDSSELELYSDAINYYKSFTNEVETEAIPLPTAFCESSANTVNTLFVRNCLADLVHFREVIPPELLPVVIVLPAVPPANNEAYDNEAGDNEADDNEADDDEAGENEADDDEAGENEADDNEAGDNEAGALFIQVEPQYFDDRDDIVFKALYYNVQKPVLTPVPTNIEGLTQPIFYDDINIPDSFHDRHYVNGKWTIFSAYTERSFGYHYLREIHDNISLLNEYMRNPESQCNHLYNSDYIPPNE